jgi:hypothetical protein
MNVDYENAELTTEQLADLLGVTTHMLGNWARPNILANSTDNPRYLPRPYTLAAVAGWLARPANSQYREVVLASLIPDDVRAVFEQSINNPTPTKEAA